MWRFVVGRLVQTVPVLFGVATLVFLLIHLVPGDPAVAMLGDGAAEADVQALRRSLGLDAPLATQYGAFVTGALRGNLGTSFRTGEPVTRVIAARIVATAELAAAAMAVALIVALPLGVVAAVMRGSAVDHAAMVAALTGVSIPAFWLGPLLAIVFAVELGWLPVSGRAGPASLILPAVSLGAALAAILARMTRASVLDELAADYVRAARARGASGARAVLGHALPNALVPVVTLVGLQFGAVLTGAVVTETIFAWPGVGRLLVQSIGFRDYPLVQGCILFIAVTYVAVNLATDLLYGVLDPRMRRT